MPGQDRFSVEPAEDIATGRRPGVATTVSFAGYGRGAIATTHGGQLTQIEGNPAHPASVGSTDAWLRAFTCDLYDPDRAQVVTDREKTSSWGQFFAFARADLERHRVTGGKGLRFLTGTVTSPTLTDQMRSLLREFPDARWYAHEPCNSDAVHAGAQMACGRAVDSSYRFDRADVVVALDSDFLLTDPASLRYARDLRTRRGSTGHQRTPSDCNRRNRLYAIESQSTIVGVIADHRLLLEPLQVEGFARALAAAVGVPAVATSPVPAATGAWITAVAGELLAHRGAGIVIAGREQPAVVHALAFAMNVWLQNVGATVFHSAPIALSPLDHRGSLTTLVSEMQAGTIDSLYILQTNPVYSSWATLGFVDALRRVRNTAKLGLYRDETMAACRWRLPMCHELESWGDLRAYDGTVSIVQPAIEPRYDARSPLDFIASLAIGSVARGDLLVRQYWKGTSTSPDFARFWDQSLREGLMIGSAAPQEIVRLRSHLAFPPQNRAGP